MRAYEYRCKDYSLLTPWFKKVFVTPFIRWVPWQIPANMITFFSNVLFYLAIYLALNIELLGRLSFIVIPVLLILYLIGDHLDGAQAKRTGTGSALGEFCDHYLDTFNNGLLLFILFSMFEVDNQWLMSGILFSSYLAHMAIFYEQLKTGWLTFEKLGSLEGVLLSALLIALAYFPQVYELCIADIAFGLSYFESFLVLALLGAVLTFVKTISRTPHITYGLWLFVVALVIIVVFGAPMFSVAQLTIVITLYSSWYIGKLMVAHLIDGVERSTGLFTPTVLILGYFIQDVYLANVFIIITAYMGLNIGVLMYRTFDVLKEYWVWKNPPLK